MCLCLYTSVIRRISFVFSDFKRADKTPESLQETVPGGVTSAAPGDFNPYGSGKLRLGPVLLQPKNQHEGTGGSVSCSSCRVAPATLWLLPVRSTSFNTFLSINRHSYKLFSFCLQIFANYALVFLWFVFQIVCCFFSYFLWFSEQCGTPEPSSLPHPEGLPQEVARHCIIQARLLSHRTG